MKRFHLSRKVVTVGIAAGLTLGIAGAALAYITATGSGSGSATTGTIAGITVNQSTVVTGMYPGDTVPLTGTFTNTNPGSVDVTAVTATIGTLPTGCVAGDFSITGTSNTPGEVPAGTDVGSWSGLSITMNNTALNQNSCMNNPGPINIVYASS
jgi:hypothetical protein